MHHTPHLSRIAADAIIAQMVSRADDERARYAEIDGVEHEFTVHFTTDWHRDRGDYGVLSNWAQCEIVGAWAADPDDPHKVVWAGDRRELEDLLGDKLVGEWEDDISQAQTDGGRW